MHDLSAIFCSSRDRVMWQWIRTPCPIKEMKHATIWQVAFFAQYDSTGAVAES
jgi:hypothetical protein